MYPYNNYHFYRSFLRLAGILVFSGLLFISCTRDVDLNIPKVRQEIVVDGWIENNDYPAVILTFSSRYYSDVDSARLLSLVLSSAKVTVDDGTVAEVLTLFTSPEYFPPYIYKGTRLKGAAGKTYHLTIEYGGRVLKSTTTIPEPSKLDSLWFELNPDSDSLGILKCKIHDNPIEKNYYRTFYEVKNKNRKFIPTLISNYDDKYLSANMVITLNKGNESYLDPNSDFYFNVKDTIMVKLSTVDENSHKFWISYDEEIINAPNPFASAHKEVISNIEGGLGIWCGYSSAYYGIIPRKPKK